MIQTETCYMCAAPATSREHVPPLCLFPEPKDVLGFNFRKDLITVPSCDLHNSKKSTDDEFLMVTMASVVGGNFLGYLHLQTKISRALRRKSKDFLNKAIVRNSKMHTIESASGKKYPVMLGNPDGERLISCFRHIAHGLYYHEFHKKFEGEIRILFGFVQYNDQFTDTMLQLINHKLVTENTFETPKGSNGKVFTYNFCQPDAHGLIALKLSFYGSTDVYISYLPKGAAEPFDLPTALAKAGISTTIQVGGKNFEFNK